MLLSYSGWVAAQSCLSQKKIDLSAVGGSLYPLEATDQNGLGICHVEQLHKMMKARLPGHPDLSRIQISIADKKEKDKDQFLKKSIRWKGKDGTVGGTYLDAGTSCEVFNRIKGKSICPRADDRFEQLTKMHPDYQGKIVNALSAYFDSKPKQSWLNPSTNYDSLFWLGPEVTEAFKKCPVSEKRMLSLKIAYKNILVENQSKLGTKYKAELQVVDKLNWNDFVIPGDQLLAGRDYLSYVLAKLPYYSKNKTSHFGKLLLAEANHFSIEMKNQEACVTEQLKSKNHMLFCGNDFNKAFEEVLDLTKTGLELSEVLKILKGSEDRDEFFSDAFSCDGKKYTIPSNVNCLLQDLTDLAKKSKSEADFIHDSSQAVINKLQYGKAVGVSVCTRFFKNPKAKTRSVGTSKYDCGDKKSTHYAEGEGSHAVTIIGSRCHKGVQEFLVQNSWGNGCFYADQYECTHRGGFWAPARAVMPNVRSLQTLE